MYLATTRFLAVVAEASMARIIQRGRGALMIEEPCHPS
jgi:hypothetical protein